MPNHIHLFFRTPQPNLSRGMQYLLSGYANWFNTRHRRSGHVYQGRFKGELIEDEHYFWNVSRYLHLNPVRGKRPLVHRPDLWPWSSYPGYHRKQKQVGWIAYDSVYRAWEGEHGGNDAVRAYRRFVESGCSAPPENPMQKAIDGWLLGSQAFVEKVRRLMKKPKFQDEVPAARRLASFAPSQVLAAVAIAYDVAQETFAVKHNKAVSRDIAALLARRLTTATLRELSELFGLGHPDSVRNLIRRAEKSVENSLAVRKKVEAIRRSLDKKAENRV